MLNAEAKILDYLARVDLLEKEGPFFRRLRLEGLEPFIKAGNLDLLYAMGASSMGGRFTKKGGLVKCLYVSEEELKAKAECYRLRGLSTSQLEQAAISPGCSYSVNAKMERILDLTDPVHLDNVQTTQDELEREFRGAPLGTVIPSQVLGHLAYTCGRFDGIKYHSAVRSGFVNYVIFRDRLRTDAIVTAM